jgi:hypothetical protein
MYTRPYCLALLASPVVESFVSLFGLPLSRCCTVPYVSMRRMR